MTFRPQRKTHLPLMLLCALALSACGNSDSDSGAANAATNAPNPVAEVKHSSGMLRITTEPGDAQIFINGQRKGNSPSEPGQSFAIKLSETSYTVEAVKPDGELKEWHGKKTDVFVANETMQTITLKLEVRETPAGKVAREKAEADKKQKAQVQIAKALSPAMVLIPAGRFQMGCVEGKDCYDINIPVHAVEVRAFQMGKHEVTFNEWDACVADGGCTHWPDDKGWGRGQRPVINVSWDDIQTYLTWLRQKTGTAYRLPSEAEWEYAARAGTTTRFSTGDCITTAQANFGGNNPAEGCPKGESREKTLEVGSFAANPFGLFDMHGNVWEWTQDCWKNSYSGAPSDGSATSDGDCSKRVVRSGSWYSSGRELGSATRFGDSRDLRHSLHGFRLSRSN